jgi:hypothetical protein
MEIGVADLDSAATEGTQRRSIVSMLALRVFWYEIAARRGT